MNYTFRKSALEKAKTYTIVENTLEISEEGKEQKQILPFDKLASVKLAYLAKRHMPDIYYCTLTTSGGNNIQINSHSYKGVASFEDRSAAYSEFISALHAKLSDPSITFTKGINPLVYWLSMVFFVIMGLFLASIAVFALIPWGLLILVMLVFLFFRLKTHFTKNKPGNYDPMNIPEELLP